MEISHVRLLDFCSGRFILTFKESGGMSYTRSFACSFSCFALCSWPFTASNISLATLPHSSRHKLFQNQSRPCIPPVGGLKGSESSDWRGTRNTTRLQDVVPHLRESPAPPLALPFSFCKYQQNVEPITLARTLDVQSELQRHDSR
jgi:hypothetical protein